MKTHFTTLLKSIIYGAITPVIISCTNGQNDNNLLSYIDTRVGTAASTTHTAGMFGKHTEEYGQTLPAVLEPNGMNFWTPQTQDTEQKCIAPYYYRDSLFQGFRNSHWIVGGCTQDYGSMTLTSLFESLRCTPQKRGTRFSHKQETATPSYYSVSLPDEHLQAEMTGRSRSAIFRFTYQKAGKAYLIVNPNSDEGEGYIEIDTLQKRIYGYNPVHRIYQGWGEPAGYSGHFIVDYQKEPCEFGTFHEDSVFPGHIQIKNEKNIGIYIGFHVESNEQVLVKAASSFTDKKGAERNLLQEIPQWDFEQTQEKLTTIGKNICLPSMWKHPTRKLNKSFMGLFYRASFSAANIQ